MEKLALEMFKFESVVIILNNFMLKDWISQIMTDYNFEHLMYSDVHQGGFHTLLIQFCALSFGFLALAVNF